MGSIVLGLDLGFGDLKICTAYVDGTGAAVTPVIGKFPTAIAHSRRGGIRGLDNSNKRYDYNGQEYIIGNDAVSSDKVLSMRDLDLLIQYSPLFVHKVFELLANEHRMQINGNVNLAIGLPLGNFKAKKDDIVQLLSRFEVSGCTYGMKQVKAFAQGVGVFMDILINPVGKKDPEFDGKTLVILDIGFNTLDVLCVRNGISSSNDSCMINKAGICRITRELSDVLKAGGMELNEQELKAALVDKKILNFGKRTDLKKILEAITTEYAEYLYNEVLVRLGDFMRNAERLIIAGGGAYYVKSHFEKKLGRKFIHVPKQPEFSNARGFFKTAVGLDQ